MLHARAVAIVIPTIIQCHSIDFGQNGLYGCSASLVVFVV